MKNSDLKKMFDESAQKKFFATLHMKFAIYVEGGKREMVKCGVVSIKHFSVCNDGLNMVMVNRLRNKWL